MKNFYIAGVFLFFAFVSNQAFSANSSKTSKWIYDKTSETNIVGLKDVNIISNLNRDYENITIMMDNKRLLIKDSAHEHGDICSTAYVEIKKTPLSYYLSQNSVDIYKEVFNRSHRTLPENLYILESRYPGQECPAPFNEIVKVNDYLTVVEQGYILFFKKENTHSPRNTNEIKNDNWSTYCHDDERDQEFDGSSKVLCFFPGMNLNVSYNKFKAINEISSIFLNEILPVKNEEYKINSAIVRYSWKRMQDLNISVELNSETINYIFHEHSSGTSLLMSTDSQY